MLKIDKGVKLCSEVVIYTARGPSVNRGSRRTAQGPLIHLIISRTLTAGLRDGTTSQRGAPAERDVGQGLFLLSLSEGVKVLILRYSLWHKD